MHIGGSVSTDPRPRRERFDPSCEETIAMRNFIELIQESLGQVREIMPWDLGERWQEDPNLLLLDVREPDEFDAMHIAGSLNVPRGILESACEWEYEETVPELVRARERGPSWWFVAPDTGVSSRPMSCRFWGIGTWSRCRRGCGAGRTMSNPWKTPGAACRSRQRGSVFHSAAVTRSDAVTRGRVDLMPQDTLEEFSGARFVVSKKFQRWNFSSPPRCALIRKVRKDRVRLGPMLTGTSGR